MVENNVMNAVAAELINGNNDEIPEITRAEQDFRAHEAKNDWKEFYENLKDVALHERNVNGYKKDVGRLPKNKSLNRYNNVIAYDHSRIELRSGNVDYICANIVVVAQAERRYILSQGPLNETIGHFWLMIWEQNCAAIIMLNNLRERGETKCAPYWPRRMGRSYAFQLTDVNLVVETTRIERTRSFTRRWFRLTNTLTKESREILHFHYTCWVDFGMPTSSRAILEFLLEVRRSGALENDVGPAVVHCSAGIGRSGTFCLVDACLMLIERNIDCDVAEVLSEMRTYREGLVQNENQLFFAYRTIVEGLTLLKDTTFLNHRVAARVVQPGEESADEEPAPVPVRAPEIPPPLPQRNASLQLPHAPRPDGVLALNVLNQNENEPEPAAVPAEIAMRDRPLPPLPVEPQNNLDDNNGNDDEDDDDLSGHESDDNENAIGQRVQLIPTESEDSLSDSSVEDELEGEQENGNGVLPPAPASLENGYARNDANIANGTANADQQCIVNNAQERNRKNDVRQLPYAERQANLQHNIDEMRRKRRIAEEETENSKKRWRLVFVSVGVALLGTLVLYMFK